VTGSTANSLATALFSLEEPWRGRFLELVANLATRHTCSGQQPTREEVTEWLGSRPALYEQVRLLLDAWQNPGDGSP
jgi:hypothetical protein